MSTLGIYLVEGKAARERPANAFTMPKAVKCEGASTSHRYGRWAYVCDLYFFYHCNEQYHWLTVTDVISVTSKQPTLVPLHCSLYYAQHSVTFLLFIVFYVDKSNSISDNCHTTGVKMLSSGWCRLLSDLLVLGILPEANTGITQYWRILHSTGIIEPYLNSFVSITNLQKVVLCCCVQTEVMKTEFERLQARLPMDMLSMKRYVSVSSEL